jgi:hypothetical protein
MKTSLPRRLVLALALAGTCFTSGCASFNEGLWLAADALREQQETMAYQAYLRDTYGPRPASDTSARGIK